MSTPSQDPLLFTPSPTILFFPISSPTSFFSLFLCLSPFLSLCVCDYIVSRVTCMNMNGN